MRPFLLLTTALTVTGILGSAHANSDSTTPQERWEGYRAADSAEVQNLNLPFQSFAENAVFEVETIGFTRTPGERFEEVNVNNEPVITDSKRLASDLRLMQIETCRKQDLQFCPVLSYSTRGTTFFNRGRFVTCRHLFHNWISIASQLNGNRSVRTISPPMILRNSAGEVVYNSAQYTESPTPTEKPQMGFTTINDDPRLNYQTHGVSYPSTAIGRPVAQADYVEMTLSERIVRDYALTERTQGTNNLRPNEETYIAGYPAQTNVFPNAPGDAPGRALVLSNGFAGDAFHDYSLLQTTNFAGPGTSGSPMLTANGELAGVNCGGRGDQNPNATRAYAYPLGSAIARDYWSRLPYPSEEQIAAIATTPTNLVNQ